MNDSRRGWHPALRVFPTGSGIFGSCGAASALRAIILAAGSLTTSLPAWADSLNEIIVTARKRQENSLEVPAAISAVSGNEIESLGISDLKELSERIPNFLITTGPVSTNVNIRGINSGPDAGFEQSVGLFVDGVYSGKGRPFRAPFLDVAQVETVKGPQGVLYGKNTTAGAIIVTSRAPSRSFEAYARASYETEVDRYAAEAAVSGPISSTLSGRLAGRISHADGFMRNTLTDTEGPELDDYAYRGTLTYDGGRIAATLKYEQSRVEVRNQTWQINEAGPWAPVFLQFDPGFEAEVNDLQSSSAASFGITPSDQDNTYSRAASLALDIPAGRHSIRSITGYTHYDLNFALDADFAPPPLVAVVSPRQESRQLSQELQVLSEPDRPVAYLAGLYVQSNDFLNSRRTDIDGRTLADTVLTVGGFPPDIIALGRATTASMYQSLDQDSLSWALYGEAYWQPHDRWKLSGGLRYTLEHKDGMQQYIGTEFLSTVPLTDPLALLGLNAFFGLEPHRFDGLSRREKKLLPSVSVEYLHSRDARLYLSYSRGSKSGGFADDQRSANPSTIEFADEDVGTIEAGAKLSSPGGTATATAAAFHSRFDDVQVSSFNGIDFRVSNAAEATSQGIEIDLLWSPTTAWTLGTSVAYLDAEYDRFDQADCIAGSPPGCTQSLREVDTPFSPEFSGTVFARHLMIVGDNLQLEVGIDASYTGEYNYAFDQDPIDVQDSYTLLNSFVSLTSGNGDWDVRLVGRNLTDERIGIWGFDAPIYAGAHVSFVNPPRSWLVQATLKFD